MWCEDDELVHIEDTLRSESLDFSDEEIKKPCTKCGKEKRLDEFGDHPKGKYGKQARCTKCETERKANYKKSHPEGVKRCNRRSASKRKERCRQDPSYRSRRSQIQRYSHIKGKVHLTAQEQRLRLEAQGNVCAICGQPETACNQYGLMPLALDHDHSTGKARGFLCMRCNTKLAALEDKDFVATAQAYLGKYR